MCWLSKRISRLSLVVFYMTTPHYQCRRQKKIKQHKNNKTQNQNTKTKTKTNSSKQNAEKAKRLHWLIFLPIEACHLYMRYQLDIFVPWLPAINAQQNIATHNTQHTTHNTQHTTHNTQHNQQQQQLHKQNQTTAQHPTPPTKNGNFLISPTKMAN